MAFLEQHGSGVYRVRFRVGKKEYFRSCETSDETEAQGVLTSVKETISLLKRGRLTIPSDVDDVGKWVVSGGRVAAKPKVKKTCTLKEVIDAYFASIPEGAKSANSLLTERIHLNHVKRIVKANTPIDSIGVAELQGYVTTRSKESGIRGRKIQPETIRKEMVTFGTLRRFAKARGWCDGDIDGKQIRRPKAEEKPSFQTWEQIEAEVKKGGLTEEQQRDFWDCLFLREKEVLAFLTFVEKNAKAPWLYPALAIAAYTGARRSEILRSETRDFDLDRKVLTLREKKRDHTRRTTYRTVNIHKGLRAIIKVWLVHHPGGKYTICTQPNVMIAPDEALRAFEQTVAGSKWEALRGWHVLRHSFASICAMKGLRDSTISKWMGHETEAMKQRYRHLYPEVMEEEMGKLFN
jgi:integrase